MFAPRCLDSEEIYQLLANGGRAGSSPGVCKSVGEESTEFEFSAFLLEALYDTKALGLIYQLNLWFRLAEWSWFHANRERYWFGTTHQCELCSG